MSAQLIDGIALSRQIRAEVAARAARLPQRPGLAVILVGEDPASQVYVRSKGKQTVACGMASFIFLLVLIRMATLGKSTATGAPVQAVGH